VEGKWRSWTLKLILKNILKYLRKHNCGDRRRALKGKWGCEVLRSDTSKAGGLSTHLDVASMNEYAVLSPQKEVDSKRGVLEVRTRP